jgi:hypothetical protein
VSWNDDPTLIICQRAYLSDNTNAYYAGPGSDAAEGSTVLRTEAPITPPTRSILPLDDATIDQIAGSYVPLDATRSFRFGEVQATLQAGTYLYPWHQYALAILNSAMGDRPVYFASSGNAASALGLDDYLVRQGLAFKLNPGPLPESAPAGVVRMPEGSPLNSVTGRWVDMPRTEALLESVFMHRGGIPEWGHWPDAATMGIPNYYAWVYYALAQAAYVQGDTTSMEQWRERGEAWSTLGDTN